MTVQKLRNRTGQLLGQIKFLDGGTFKGHDASGCLRATFDPNTNETRDSTGKLEGKGDVLSLLTTYPTR